uniref:J domain-containing protein n=1 Tax=Fervidobacterium pennivorans TaxID=93466 RepID=A0A7C4VWW1_FERPE
MRNPYEILGIPEDATLEEINQAYNSIVSKLTDGRYRGTILEGISEKRLDEVNQAYEFLMKNQNNIPSGYRPGYYRRYYRNGCCPDCGDLCTACACIWGADTCCECMGGDCI